MGRTDMTLLCSASSLTGAGDDERAPGSDPIHPPDGFRSPAPTPSTDGAALSRAWGGVGGRSEPKRRGHQTGVLGRALGALSCLNHSARLSLSITLLVCCYTEPLTHTWGGKCTLLIHVLLRRSRYICRPECVYFRGGNFLVISVQQH